MNKEVIESIEILLTGTFKKRNCVSLHELMWTIDAKYHLTPSVNEINSGIEKINGIRISFGNDSINLNLSGESTSDKITQKHVDIALDYYRKTIEQISKKYK